MAQEQPRGKELGRGTPTSSEEIIPNMQPKHPLVQLGVLTSRKGAVRGGCSKQRKKTLLHGHGGFHWCPWGQGWQGTWGAVLGTHGGTEHPRLAPTVPLQPFLRWSCHLVTHGWVGVPSGSSRWWWPCPHACPCPHHPKLLLWRGQSQSQVQEQD